MNRLQAFGVGLVAAAAALSCVAAGAACGVAVGYLLLDLPPFSGVVYQGPAGKVRPIEPLVVICGFTGAVIGGVVGLAAARLMRRRPGEADAPADAAPGRVPDPGPRWADRQAPASTEAMRPPADRVAQGDREAPRYAFFH